MRAVHLQKSGCDDTGTLLKLMIGKPVDTILNRNGIWGEAGLLSYALMNKL
jgi:hypothetical protein